MYHREGKKCDEKEREREIERERERGGAERAELSRARKEREIIGSCEYLIGDHLYLYLYVYTRESSILITPPKKKREESKNLNKIRHTQRIERRTCLYCIIVPLFSATFVLRVLLQTRSVLKR